VNPDFAKLAALHRDAGVHNVIVAGESYGQGSSREHAALCPMFLGVKAVLAKSIERIHLANLINFGIVPLVFENPSDYGRISAGDQLAMPDMRRLVESGTRGILKDITTGADIPVTVGLSGRQREILLAGGLLNCVVKQ
jgi:aconitate hydratase